MNSETISALRILSLNARALLSKEAESQLEGIYGLLPDGSFAESKRYPALTSLDEARETRRRLEQYVADEQAAGIAPNDAREALVKEIAFTRLNRTVALKMMENRGLVRESVTRLTKSNGFLRWLTEDQNKAQYDKYEVGDLPQNAMGEGPRQEAYRYYLLDVCAELATEIRVLFDPDNLASRIFPRPRVLEQLVAMMSVAELTEAWEPGREETIGWIYQFFNEGEKREVFDKLYKKKQKIRKEDIPAATELFTPNWIVKWLVQNSLGRYWMQMHADSLLIDQLDYLVPLSGNTPAAKLKPVVEIKMLDPACGTMHFGIVAFDLFAQMYREEIENAGKNGWPAKPSVENSKDIPAAILANNIYGIDIDLRAVQLSALALYLKAKSLNPNAELRETKLVAANIHMGDGEAIKKYLDSAGLGRPVYRRILTALAERLKDSEQLGSLLRIEDEIRDLVEKEKKEFFNEGQQLNLFGKSQKDYEKRAVQMEFWDELDVQIEQTLHHFAKTLSAYQSQIFFAGETVKGLRLMEILANQYDIVATNPPYLPRRNMNFTLSNFLQKKYPNSKSDLYAAFIERCAEKVVEDGRLAMITQQSFMFISSYENMRCASLGQNAIETVCHVGPRAFESISGEKVNTVLFIFRKCRDKELLKLCIGKYFRLVKERDAESKRKGFEKALENIYAGQNNISVYEYQQNNFKTIPGNPFVYWISPTIRNLFAALPNFEKVAQPRVGLQTGENSRFLRYWWEIGTNRIGFKCTNGDEFALKQFKWAPYMKGGGFKRWYGNQEYLVNWKGDGKEIKVIGIESGKIASRPQNTEFYFRRGVTWSDLTTSRFNARLSPGGFIFDVKGSSTFPENIPLALALLNSSFANYTLNILNPTASFQVGDLSRLPIPSNANTKLTEMVELAIILAKNSSELSETTYDFITPPDWLTGLSRLNECQNKLAKTERDIDEEIYKLYSIGEEDRAAIDLELSVATMADDDNSEEYDEGNGKNKQESTDAFITRDDLARQWISYTVGIVLGRFEPGSENGLGRGNFSPEISRKLQELTDPDGIMVMDPGHNDDLPTRIILALSTMLGETEAEKVVRAATGKEGLAEDLLRQYIERNFFKAHISQYRKRPVYWLLQSPKKKYGLWLFHEKLMTDSFFRIRTEYVEPKIKHLENQIGELRKKRDDAEGRTRTDFQNKIDEATGILDDVREFEKRLRFISEERGYTPHIDDGVLLNMAPLWELIPSWPAEPKKAWQALQRGDFDWAYHAMDYRPEQVREKCKTNKSYAIAHGLEDLYQEPVSETTGKSRKRAKRS